MIEIKLATSQDYTYLVHKDHHVQPEVITKKIEDAEIIVGECIHIDRYVV